VRRGRTVTRRRPLIDNDPKLPLALYGANGGLRVLCGLTAQTDCPDALFHRLFEGWLRSWTGAFSRDFTMTAEEITDALNAVKNKVAKEAPVVPVDALRRRLTKQFPELFFQ
jgi:hypothetical protein